MFHTSDGTSIVRHMIFVMRLPALYQLAILWLLTHKFYLALLHLAHTL
ncbi:hypothetical protein Patl1_32749 [Pistacia atlantica]|uniref:Uncharacterized protein n=1 Tax=Pistacia atlantica TaxID=434234 RepID=A0ACC1ALZ4_9ROSI|nr:hypothetical protein Patl1_32749 [Pistacia atlantica]